MDLEPAAMEKGVLIVGFSAAQIFFSCMIETQGSWLSQPW
jgi:hypothetical protein